MHELKNWQPISSLDGPSLDGVWDIQRRHGALTLRAVAVRLQPGFVCVYSPVPHAGAEALRELAALGTPILLAPNAYHTLGVREHIDAFPDAKLVTSPRAASRLRAKTGITAQELRVLEEKLPADVAVHVCPNARNGEVWLSVRRGDQCAWIVGDAFLNFSRLPSGPFGLAMRALRMGPGVSIGATFKWLLRDRRAYREWVLARIAEDRPTVLIPCHGNILADPQLPNLLEALVRRRI